MLGADGIGQIAEMLVGHGLAADTPVAIVSGGATGRQQSIEGTLATIADVAAQAKIGSPAMAVIGNVVKLRSKLNWFERRPLFGQRIVVTRAREQAGQLSRRLREHGAEVLEVPTIKLEPPTRREDLVDALLELNAYDWLVFTSPNGVSKFFEYFFKRFHDMRDLGGARIAAVGPATANKLKELHLQVDLMPDEALASEIAAAFAEFETIENLKICLLRAEVANRELPEALEALGAIVDDVACYQTVPETEDATGAAASLLERGADWVAFTSASTVEHFHARFDLPALLSKFPQLKTATIGPETSKALAALGLKPALEAKQHTLDGLVAALLAAQHGSQLGGPPALATGRLSAREAAGSPGWLAREISPEQNAAGNVHIASAKASPGGVKARCLSQTCIAHSRRAKLSERVNAKVIVVDQTQSAQPQPGRASAPVRFAPPAALVARRPLSARRALRPRWTARP